MAAIINSILAFAALLWVADCSIVGVVCGLLSAVAFVAACCALAGAYRLATTREQGQVQGEFIGSFYGQDFYVQGGIL